MKLGDLVVFELGANYRRIGIVVKIGADDYKRKRLKINSNPDTLHMIMLSSGGMMWMQEKRLRVVNESR